MLWTSPALSDAFRTDAWWLTRNREEQGLRCMQGWNFRTHTWIFNAEYFRGFAVASQKDTRIAKESKFWSQVQILTVSFLCMFKSLLCAELPYLHDVHTSQECSLIQTCQITPSASHLPASSHDWTPQTTMLICASCEMKSLLVAVFSR